MTQIPFISHVVRYREMCSTEDVTVEIEEVLEVKDRLFAMRVALVICAGRVVVNFGLLS